MIPLSAKRRSELRAEAHTLSPVVLIGDKGLTDEVVAEIDRSLKAHELVKVRAASGEREARDAWYRSICERLLAHPVQHIGKVFVFYRENPEPVKPARTGARAEDGGKDARGEGKRRPRAGVVTGRGLQAQRARDAEKQRLRDITDMVRKGKIPPKAKFGPRPTSGAGSLPAAAGGRGDERGEAKRTSRPRSRTPSPLPESAPRRRRRSTSR